jgi:hypothetical protein
MSTQAFDPALHPRAGDGTFSETYHPEGTVTLAAPAPRTYDPEEFLVGGLEDLRHLPVEWTRELYYGTRKAVQAGETTYEEFLDGLLAKNHGGRCKKHEFDRFDTERYCHDCLTSFMVEARTNPKPLPSPRGVVPVRQENHRLTGQEIDYSYDEEFRVTNTTTKMTGDEQFEAAVRRMFKAPADAAVEVIQEETESGTEWTRESSTEITVKCGDREAVYNYMGDLMKALDQAEQNPQAMALRFMRADSGERPLLNGIAAVYLSKGDYSDPVPVFGKIRNVFSGGREPSMDFLHIDGRQEYLKFDRVVSILETDQSSDYDESE